MLESKKNILFIFRIYISIFLLMFVYYAFAGYRETIPGYMLFLQCFFFLIYTVSLYGAIKIKTSDRMLAVYVFLYSLLSAFIIRFISWEYLNEPFFGGVDSQTYDWIARVGVTRKFSYSKYIQFLDYNDYGIDDWGMPSIVFEIYRIFGSGRLGQNMLLVVNAFVITVSMLMLGKILDSFKTERLVRKFCMIAFACFPFLPLTAAVGLKENFFVLIILSAFYYLTKYAETRRGQYLTCAVVFIIGSLFFRLAVFAMLLIALFVSLISNSSNKRLVLNIIIIGGFVGLMGLSVVIKYLYGREISAVLATTGSRTAEGSDAIGSIGMWIIQGLALFLGPFANFAKMSEYAIVHSSGVLFKGVLGYPLLIGLCQCIRHYQWRYFPLIIYFFMSFAMFILAGVSLDMRYQVTMFCLTFPFIAKTLASKSFKKGYFIYCSILILLTWFYNQR